MISWTMPAGRTTRTWIVVVPVRLPSLTTTPMDSSASAAYVKRSPWPRMRAVRGHEDEVRHLRVRIRQVRHEREVRRRDVQEDVGHREDGGRTVHMEDRDPDRVLLERALWVRSAEGHRLGPPPTGRAREVDAPIRLDRHANPRIPDGPEEQVAVRVREIIREPVRRAAGRPLVERRIRHLRHDDRRPVRAHRY